MIISASNISIHYDKETFKIPSFKVKRGDFITILGPNGGGKTSFIKAILGLIPFEGTIKLFDKDVKIFDEWEKIGYLPQFSFTKVDFPITIKEVIEMGGNKRDLSKELGLNNLLDKLISEVSGGERQRALIARALANDPELIILDEPESGLDSSWRSRINKLLEKLNKEEHKTIVLISHDLTNVLNLTNKLACINKTTFIHGNKELVLSNMKEVYGCDIALLLHGKNEHIRKDHWVVREHDY